ncbi:MAG TPA: tetratricopeptide repeat protein, partial [Blastocatellia bacterium]|nr:tetratricopeptide repeat protein [Blastocatellia bacterium]
MLPVSGRLRGVSLCVVTLALSVAVHAQQAERSTSGRAATAAQTELSPAARASIDAAIAALQKGALNDAERSARSAVFASPRSPLAHNILGVVMDRLGRTEAAFEEFGVALKLDPNFVNARNNVGRMLAERGKIKEAIVEFERVLRTDPSHVQAHYNLGALYVDSGDFDNAARHFAQARAASPDDLQLALAFLNVAYRANLTAEGDEVAGLVERRSSTDGRALFTLATVLAQSRQYERAARLFARVNELMPKTYEVLYNLGLALYNLDRNDDAARFLAEAADLNPVPAETHFRLGLIASGRSDHANAVEEFKHAVERQPKNASFHHLLGREYFRVGFWEGAIGEFSQAVGLDPKNPAYLLARADANYRKGEWVHAAADFDQAASIDPKVENIELWQGLAHRAAGDFDVSRQYLERFVAKHPDHIDALSSLGYIAIEQGR